MTLLACVINLPADEFLRHPPPDPARECHQGGGFSDTSDTSGAAPKPLREHPGRGGPALLDSAVDNADLACLVWAHRGFVRSGMRTARVLFNTSRS